MSRLRNTLLDNSQPLQMTAILKGFFPDSGYTAAMFATGYPDIPGLALVCDEWKCFFSGIS
jgi:hypothetical protein